MDAVLIIMGGIHFLIDCNIYSSMADECAYDT